MAKLGLNTSRLSKGISFLVLAILFIALVVINNSIFRNVRLDLTEKNLYTLSEGTRNILADIKQPINLYLFFSEKASRDYPQIRNHHVRVKEMLEEYRLRSNDMLKISYIDPEPFSEDEDRATQVGIQAVSVGDETLYFGLAGTNIVDDVEVIPFFQSNKEIFLEYELGQLIYSLTRLKKPVMGIMTTLSMYPTQIDPQTGRMNNSWVITEQIEKLFDVRLVLSDATEIEEEIDVLMVVHPKNLGDSTLYAIDQFIMRGGRGLFFVDPFANAEFLPIPENQPLQDSHAKSSSLNRLFDSWGFSVDENSVIGDRKRALKASLSTGSIVRHIAMVGTKQQDFDIDDAAMSGLQSVNFGMSSYIKANNPEDAAVKIDPLITTSKNSMPIPLQQFRFMANPDILQRGFKATGEKYILAARVRGKLKSAFTQAPQNDDENESDAPEPRAHLAATKNQAELVVIADTDLLTDSMWVRVQNFFGRRIVQPLAGNGDFVVNLLESLFGDTNLINIRSRASYSRPFTRIDKIETEADQKYRETAEQLQKELNQIEARLRELQKEKADKQSALLTQEQQRELNNARQKKIKVRKQLRHVLHQQNEDIENLGTTLKIINIGLVPLLVMLIAAILGFLRVRNQYKEISAA